MSTNEGEVNRAELYPNPSGIMAQDGKRLVDGLAAVFPQGEIERSGLATEIGNTVLLACRKPLEADTKLVRGLSPREYEILLLLAHGQSYEATARDLSIRGNTVRTHRQNIYCKLDAPKRNMAATFIPLEKSVVMPFVRERNILDEDFCSITELEPREKEVFKMIGEGYLLKNIGDTIGLDSSRVGYYDTSKIYKTLGIPKNTHQLTFVRRLAGAIANLDDYENALKILDESIKPESVLIIRNIIGRLDEQKKPISSKSYLTKIENNALINKLEQSGYVPSGTVEHGRLTLSGVVAARLLIGRNSNDSILTDFETRGMVRQLIERQVAEALV